MTDSGQVIGVGGVFIKAKDREATKLWYKNTLGLSEKQPGWGYLFDKTNDKNIENSSTVFSVFDHDTEYLKPGSADFMINFRVKNLDDLVKQLKSKSIAVEGPVSEEGCGTFAWIVDPNGIKIELWEA